jgi:hypothetical protein
MVAEGNDRDREIDSDIDALGKVARTCAVSSDTSPSLAGILSGGHSGGAGRLDSGRTHHRQQGGFDVFQQGLR